MSKIKFSKEWFRDDIANNRKVIKFSDLEFEYENKVEQIGNAIKSYDSQMRSSLITKPETIKNTILRSDVKLDEGDIICVHYDYNDIDMIGVITKDHILYDNGDFDMLGDIDGLIRNKLLWYITRDSIKGMGGEISQLLFENKLSDELKELIIYIEEKPKEIKKKTVEVFEVKFQRKDMLTRYYIRDNEEIEIFKGDVVSPTDGIRADEYGVVVKTKFDKLTEEQLNNYYKIAKIK